MDWVQRRPELRVAGFIREKKDCWNQLNLKVKDASSTKETRHKRMSLSHVTMKRQAVQRQKWRNWHVKMVTISVRRERGLPGTVEATGEE